MHTLQAKLSKKTPWTKFLSVCALLRPVGIKNGWRYSYEILYLDKMSSNLESELYNILIFWSQKEVLQQSCKGYDFRNFCLKKFSPNPPPPFPIRRKGQKCKFLRFEPKFVYIICRQKTRNAKICQPIWGARLTELVINVIHLQY